MTARKYTDDQVNEAAELREKGLSYGQIARMLDMSVGSVSWHCLKLGADSPNTITNVDTPTGPMVVLRGNNTVRRFSEEEDRLLFEMDIAGKRVSHMAARLDRKPNSVRGRLMTLARRAERIAQIAERAPIPDDLMVREMPA